MFDIDSNVILVTNLVPLMGVQKKGVKLSPTLSCRLCLHMNPS